MKRRIVSFCTALLLMLSMLSSFTGLAVTVPNKDILLVGADWTGTNLPTYYTYQGISYHLNWGVNAFATVTDAITAAEAGDTILVTEGTYGETVIINKNLTIAGIKNNINPNLTSGQFEAWPLNPERGTGEAVFTGNIMLGVNGDTVYSDVTDITIDGIMLTGGGQLRSNNGAAGECNITLNNIYIKNCTKNTSPIYLEAFYGGGNLYKRNVVIKNVRYEGQTQALGMMLSAESADISGVYMHTDCTKALFDHLSAAAVTEDNAPAVTWTVRDSQFCNPVYRVIYASTDGITANNIKLTETIGMREKVTFNLKNSTFLGCHADTGNGHIVACRPATDNFYFNITDNTFYTTKLPGVTTYPIAGYVTNTAINYGNKVTVNSNRIIGYRYAFSFPDAGDASNVNGNYHERLDGTVGAIVTSGPVTQTWWYLNRELTARSDGATVNVSADRLLNLNTDVKFMGRTYAENGVRYFSWTNAGFEFNFKGTGASCTIHSNAATGTNLGYLKVYVDGVHTKTITLGVAKQSVVLATGLSDEAHTIRVIKRTNGRSSSAGVSRIWLEAGGKIYQPNAVSTRTMQFVGDSITVGYGSDNPNGETEWSTATEDGTITYAALTAQYFSAENHTIAVSGRGIVKNVGGDSDDFAPAMYEYTDWRKHDQWDHSQYVPDVIVINYGTNDKSAGVSAADFKVGCKAFVQQVRKDNPTSIIIYAYGFMGNSYATQVSEVVSELNAAGDSKIHYLALTPITSSEASLGHPNTAAHADRAQTLIAKVAEVTGWTKETGHNYVTTSTGASTCKNEGQRIKVCSLCGDTVIEAIETIAHTPAGEIFPELRATCGAAGTGYQLCSVCGKVAKTDIAIPATGQHTAGAPDVNGKVYCIVCQELLSTIPTDGDKVRLETENVINHYFANGAHQVLAGADNVVIRPIGGKLYKDTACTMALDSHISVLPGKTTYYVKADDGSVYPLYLYRETGTPALHNTFYLDDDIGTATGKVAFWDGVNVYYLDGQINAVSTLTEAEGFSFTKDGSTANIYIAPGYYAGNDDAFNTSVNIFGSNHNINPNVRSDNNVWSLNAERLPETVIDGALVYYFDKNDQKNVHITVKGCTFVGESSNGPLYIVEARTESHTKTMTMDIENNIFKGWGSSFNSAAIWANSLCAKSGVIKNNHFEFTAPDGYSDNPSDFCRGIFMRNIDGLVIDANRFIGYPTVGWMSSEMGDGNSTLYGKNNFTFQNNRAENCGPLISYALNAEEMHLNIFGNDFIGCDNTDENYAIQIPFYETEQLPVDFSKISISIRGNRFIDCYCAIDIFRHANRYLREDMRDVTLNINENRFINPAQKHTEKTAFVDTIIFSFYCDNTLTPELDASDAPWDFSRNYFYSPNFETDIHDPSRYVDLAINGKKSFVADDSLFAPYYTDYALTTLSDGSSSAAISGVSATAYVGEYDGAPHSITVTAPAGTTVTYAEPADNLIYSGVNPTYTEIGTYTVHYKVEKAGTAPIVGTSTVTITTNTAPRTPVADKTVTYTYGTQHTLDSFADSKDKDTVVYIYDGNTYPTMPAFASAGTYTVGIRVTNPNYVTFEQTATLTINKASLSGVTMQGYDGLYDGARHSITLSGVPADVIAKYRVNGGEWTNECPYFTDVTDGSIPVEVKLESSNYIPRTEALSIRIAPALIEGVTLTPTVTTVDGTLKELVTVAGIKSGDTVQYSLDGRAFTNTVPTAAKAGDYLVAVKISRFGHLDKTLIATASLSESYVDPAVFTLGISGKLVENVDQKYTFTWQLQLDITEAGEATAASKDLVIKAYGIKYAASLDNLSEYIFLRQHAQNDAAAEMISTGKVNDYVYEQSETGLTKLYHNNTYHVRNTKPGKARYAAFYIAYTIDGVAYEQYSIIDCTSSLAGDGWMEGVGGTESTEEILTKLP